MRPMKRKQYTRPNAEVIRLNLTGSYLANDKALNTNSAPEGGGDNFEVGAKGGVFDDESDDKFFFEKDDSSY